MKISLNIFITFLILSVYLKAQQQHSILTGNLYADSRYVFNQAEPVKSPSVQLQPESRKSPLLAGLLSVLIPGAGEFYVGDYWKTAIFLALETAVITTAVVYDNKGNNQTEQFEKYADDYTNQDHNWSVVRYAQWIIANRLEGVDPGIITSNDESLPPWERVNWNMLNQYENGTHTLPPHGDQQYYELIGKYPQFTPGWNDFRPGQDIKEYPPNFRYYSGLRGKANDYYNVADKAVIGIYVNHFLSALDAVWSAVQFNKDLTVKLRVEQVNYADNIKLIPTLNFSLQF